MSSLAQVWIHASQFPANVRRDLIESLRIRRINHKFHYDSVKQAQRWLELHKAYSPYVTDPECATIYDHAFEAVAQRLPGSVVHLVGLGCGGGQKDTRLIRLLTGSGKETTYTPADVSNAMVLLARQAALEILDAQSCFPLVLDLATAGDLQSVFKESPAGDRAKLVTFFGMLPNFEPKRLLPQLCALIRPGDHLLLSANLAPGEDYARGVERVLPLYDNELTREWLLTFLLDLGVAREDGSVEFVIEDDLENRLKRIAAYFVFLRKCEIQLESQNFTFNTNDSIRLFFSYRHTPQLIHALLGQFGLKVAREWLSTSEEEGVFLVTH
jgi:L-histidine Nalpha-methyltransferase